MVFWISVSLWAGWGLLREGPSMDVALGIFLVLTPCSFLGVLVPPV